MSDTSEIIGALQAWASVHGRSLTTVAWKRAAPTHPAALTVLHHFDDWNDALRLAGLEPVKVRRHHWSEPEILDALRAWSDGHGRVPYSTEWAHAEPDHPSSATVLAHHGRWNVALQAARLEPPPRKSGRRNKRWSQSEIIQAIQAWTADHGRPPCGYEWLCAAPGHPAKSTVVKHFGHADTALEAARVTNQLQISTRTS